MSWCARKTIQPPLRAKKEAPFGGCATTFTQREACHWILRSLPLPYESSSFATPLSSVGRPKGKRLYFSCVPLMGTSCSGKGCTRVNMPMTLYRCSTQRLTSPDLHILCRMCTVSLWVLTNVPHDSTGEHREAYSVPRMGESPAKPDKGEPPKVANSIECSACLRSRRVIP